MPTSNLVGGYSLTSVSCVSDTFCAAVDSAGDGLTYDGQHWTLAPNALRLTGAIPAISCASDHFCVTVLGWDSVVYDGATWSARSQIVPSEGGQLDSVSCVSSSFCAAVDSDGNSLIYDGTSWTVHLAVFASHGTGAVSCSSAQFCAAVEGGTYATFDGTSWTSAASLPSDEYVSSLSCPHDGACVAVEPWGSVLTLASGGWSVEPGADSNTGLRSVSCADLHSCIAVDDFGAAIGLSGGGWSTPEVFDHVAGLLRAISCPQTTFCTAVDENGNALSFDGSQWSAPTTVSINAGYGSVSCADSALCVAGGTGGAETGAPGYSGILSTERHGVWSTIAEPKPIEHLSCPTEQFCMAIDAGSEVAIYDGTSWSSFAPAGLGDVESLACTSATFCTTGDFTFNGTTWTFIAGAGGPMSSLSCASPTFCASPDGFYMNLFDGQKWTLHGPMGAWSSDAPISCVTSRFCGLPTVLYVDGAPTQPRDIASPDGDPVDISCPSITVCYTIDSSQVSEWRTGITNPSVSSQPHSVTALSGRVVRFSAAATGSPNMLVQWQSSTDAGRHWVTIRGATTGELELTAKLNAAYRAVFTDPAGTITSAPAALTIATRPSITRQPTSRTILLGTRTTLVAAATATPTATVFWQRSVDHGRVWTTIRGATATTYTLTASGNADYRAVFTNLAGSSTTRPAAITIATRPRVARQPQSGSARAGHTVTLSARASGTPTPSVHWQRRTAKGHRWHYMRGATHTSLRIRVTSGHSHYRYRAVFHNLAGTTVTRAATAKVRD